MNSESIFGKSVVFFVALVPVYIAIYSVVKTPLWSVSALVLVSLMVVIVLHFYYGYVWAKWVTGCTSILLGGFQAPALASHPLTIYSALVGFMGIMAVAAALMLLLAHAPSAYLEQRRALRTSNVKRLLTVLNIFTLSLIIVGITKDIHQLMS